MKLEFINYFLVLIVINIKKWRQHQSFQQDNELNVGDMTFIEIIIFVDVRVVSVIGALEWKPRHL